MKLDREYWYKKFPLSKTCFYCDKPIDRSNSQRIMRIKDGPNGRDLYIMEDICLRCLPGVRANVLSKKGGSTVIDHNTDTMISSNPNHIKEIIESSNSNSSEKKNDRS